tara:strand:+ start:4463 stop:5671 length:1209 start_codon:yes stop_codon:yes gene_type:complete
MASEVKIPAMGESITSGILASWHVKDGDYVESGQAIFELETDKITSEAMAEVSGTITLKASEGDEVEIGQVVAVIDESAKAPAGGSAPNTPEPASSAPLAPTPAAPNTPGKDLPPSPAVRRIAGETGIDPKNVTGTGKDGRVTKGDMLAAGSQSPSSSMPSTAPARIPSGERQTRKKMTPLRRKIAERLVASQHEAAILTTFNEIDMSAVMNLRKQHQETFVDKHGIKLGFMSFFVKAVVQGLQAVPAINAQIDGAEIIQNNYFDIGVAVGTEKGLVVPVVRDADSQSFAEIEMQILDYAKRARAGKITMDDLEGGVFTISNGGIYGSLLSTPIINPPQSGILGMHSIQQRPVAVNGEVVIRPMMYLALSYDHRLVDGKEAVTFLIKVKECIENPTRMLLNI